MKRTPEWKRAPERIAELRTLLDAPSEKPRGDLIFWKWQMKETLDTLEEMQQQLAVAASALAEREAEAAGLRALLETIQKEQERDPNRG